MKRAGAEYLEQHCVGALTILLICAALWLCSVCYVLGVKGLLDPLVPEQLHFVDVFQYKTRIRLLLVFLFPGVFLASIPLGWSLSVVACDLQSLAGCRSQEGIEAMLQNCMDLVQHLLRPYREL